MSNTNELKFENVTVYKEDVEILERVIQKHLDELMVDYKCVFWSKDTTDSGGKAPHILKQRLQ